MPYMTTAFILAWSVYAAGAASVAAVYARRGRR
jgi:hypothetical protein